MTRDRDYALNMVRNAVVAERLPLHHFTVACRRQYQSDRLRWNNQGGDADVLGLLRAAEELAAGGVVVFEDAMGSLRDDGDPRARALLRQMLSAETRSQRLVLVFIEPPEAESHVPAVLADRFERLVVDYPRAAELESLAREETACVLPRAQCGGGRGDSAASGAIGRRDGGADPERGAGCSARRPGARYRCRWRASLQARKATQLSRELAMNVLDTANVEEPIGLDYLLEELRIVKPRMRLTGPQRARGALLIGPPGTGKTMLARAIGRLVDLPVVEFRISLLMNSLLGETERRFAQAIATLEAMAPNVVFIDEIEKAFGDSSERDGGTMMRCTGSLLSWLSDNRHPNFIIATSNSLKRMGEIGLTMTRSKRFDNTFFVDAPGGSARFRILERLLKGNAVNVGQLAEPLTGLTEKFSGADFAVSGPRRWSPSILSTSPRRRRSIRH
ncbi:MAG: ATP-binding protein [Methylococcales bacterium]